MRRSLLASAGFAVMVLLGWTAAAVSLLLALSASLREPGGRTPAAAESAESAELRTVRLALSTARAENSALRTELDRLLTKRPAGGAKTATPGAAPSEAPASPEHADLARRISDNVTRAATVGDEESKRQAAMSLMQAFQQGAGGFPAVRDAYLATEDPKAKAMLLPTMMFIGGEEARDLVLDQVHSVTDPELRKSLTILSVRYATPEHAGALKDVYLKDLDSDDPRLRTAAIRGLRYAKGKDVQQALLSVAADPSEDIRLTAIETLASRPALHEQVRALIEQESSPRIREIGQCQLLVSKGQ
ncbi:MAG: HEAT repeat domain-containing protein [Candidatus Binatia bacterium]